ncbi:hypothetical protein Aperf_G00000032872 [Anoplocephala perfoliata]
MACGPEMTWLLTSNNIVAEAFKSETAVTPERYVVISVYFGDITGLPTLSALLTPMWLVDLLSELFTAFKQTFASYYMYKMQTIVNAYVELSEPPVHKDGHQAEEVASCSVGLIMLRYCLFDDTINQAQKSGFSRAEYTSASRQEKLDDNGGYLTDYRSQVELGSGFKTSSYWLIHCNNYQNL